MNRDTNRRETFRAIFLAAIMALSMVAMGAAGFAGTAVADTDEPDGVVERFQYVDDNQGYSIEFEVKNSEFGHINDSEAGGVNIKVLDGDNQTLAELDLLENVTNDPGLEGDLDMSAPLVIDEIGTFDYEDDGFWQVNKQLLIEDLDDIDDVKVEVELEDKDKVVIDGFEVDGTPDVFRHNGSTGKNFVTIQDAINAKDDELGDTVEVLPGTYEESVEIDVEGLALEAADGAEPTIEGQVTTEAPNVEVSGFTVTNPEGDTGIRATDNASGVLIQDNVVTNISTDADDDRVRGIFVGGLDDGDSADGIEIRNNTVSNIEGGSADDEEAMGIQILEEANNDGVIEDVVVDDNTIEDILDTRSTVAVNFNGNIEGDIIDNEISGLNTEGNPDDVEPVGGFTQVIALNDGGSASDGPQNVNVEGNDISNIETTEPEEAINFGPPVHIIVGPTADAGTISIESNNFSADSVDPSSDVYINDGTDDLDLDAILNNNTFDPEALVADEDLIVPAANVGVTLFDAEGDEVGNFTTIEGAVDLADEGATIEVGPGNYEEQVEISEENVTLSGAGDETIVNGSIAASSDDIKISDLRVDTFVGKGVFPEPGGDNNAIDVSASGVHIENVNVSVETRDEQKFAEGIGVEITGKSDSVRVSNSTITSNTLSTGDGAVGVSADGNVDVEVLNNTIDVESDGYSFAVVARGGANTSVVGNTLNASGEGDDLDGVGFGVEDDETDPASQEVQFNTFDDIDIIETKVDGELDIRFNHWTDVTSVGFETKDSEGSILYDPVLTEAPSDVDSPNDVTEDYGSVLELESDGTVAIGFSAPPAEPLSEVLGEVNVTGSAFTYNAEDQSFESVGADFTPDVGDVVIITTDNDGIDEEFVMPIETGIEGAASLPTSTDVNTGWNLVAAGAENDLEDVSLVSDTGNEKIVDDTQLQDQPNQPGAVPAKFGAYEGTWLFISGGEGEISTGYAEGQTAAEYDSEVLTPTEDDD